ncbi:methionyl-tRNA formyltransferase [Planococcus lenghuensis]|uniref:Polymyxin resistance protein ArnA n=1 Tax=Planococcus lenghuensis TaxID=2213202 RepID=A0A1Q2L2U7_9BACL|nr:methionyl-tRNA formyltransferase [Planococcus lenghuensis]AQQ54212.1 polymyxin resistance protein ArnA [Planococcus lenghuensis]
MKTIVIGSVGSTKALIEEMIDINFSVDMIFSLDEKYSANVSGYEPIHELAFVNNIPYRKFKNINDEQHIDVIKQISPDYIFVIGLSQLVKKEIIDLASKGTIGFHPTPLPKHRGRAALVWQIILDVKNTKCSLFFIDEGMDSGDIIAQEDYQISELDYASDVQLKCHEAFRKLIKKTLPKLLENSIVPLKQNEKEATYLLKRTPEDGRIDWNKSSRDIQRLIRAVSKPYPGAFSFYKGKYKCTIWKADFFKNPKYIGFPGQIANIKNGYFDIVCKDGLLRVYEYELEITQELIVGQKFK